LVRRKPSNDLTKEAFPLLRKLSNLNFVGNVEGRDVFSGAVDVIVTDGFTGNVMLNFPKANGRDAGDD